MSRCTASLLLPQLDAEVVSEPVYAGRGRPKSGEEPIGHLFQICGLAATRLACVEEARNQTGVFIIATNDHSDTLTMAELLATYRAQQNVERGFRFLKSPEFLTSSMYLKKPERIEALLMVMTCSLRIYASLEHRFRQGLMEQNRSVAYMKKKATEQPTAH